MDYRHSSPANAGADEPFSARQPPFRSTASKQARSRNGSSTRSRASPRSSPYEPYSAVAGWNDQPSLTPTRGESGSLSIDAPGRRDVVMVDAKGNRLGFPYHTRYPPIRIVASGTEGPRGGSGRNHAPAPRLALREAGGGGDGDSRAGTTQPLSMTSNQPARMDAHNGVLTRSTDEARQPNYYTPAPAPHLFWPSSSNLDLRQPLPITTPYHLPIPLNQNTAGESVYISPFAPLQQTLTARGPTPPTNQALSAPPLTAAPSANASPSISTSTQSAASSASTLRSDPPDTHPPSVSQLEELDLPALDALEAELDPLSADNTIDGSTLNEDDTDWLAPLSWDDFPADVDLDFDFEFTPVDGL